MKKAVIFDMDGVISDTQKFHSKVESRILKKYGIHMRPDKISKVYAGVSDEEMFSEIFKTHQMAFGDIDKIIRQKRRLLKKTLKDNLRAVPYSRGLINRLIKKGIKLAVASGSSIKFIEQVLKTLDLLNKFDVIVSAQEVAKGKPDPGLFLLTIKKLNVKAHEAIVIEDSYSGMLAARNAGIECVGLVDDHGDYPATKTVTKLNRLSLKMLLD